MVDIKKDDDLARHSPTLADPHRPSPTLTDPRRPSFTLADPRPSFNLATLSTLATLAYTLHLADSNRKGCRTQVCQRNVPDLSEIRCNHVK